MKSIDPATLPLRDIHLPAAISWWPPAPGWWLLAALLVGAPLLGLAWWWWRRRTRLRRAALGALQELRQRARTPHETAMAVSRLLRRIALAFDAGARQDELLDEVWLSRLDALAPGLTRDPALREALLQAPYNPRAQFDTTALLAAVETWIRRLPRRPPAPRHV